MLAPGATATEPLVVAAPLKWFGRTQVHPFSGNVSTDVRGQAAMVQARRRQVPRFPWWVPTAILAILALAIPIYALIPKATVPQRGGAGRRGGDRDAAGRRLREGRRGSRRSTRPIPANPAGGSDPDRPGGELAVQARARSRSCSSRRASARSPCPIEGAGRRRPAGGRGEERAGRRGLRRGSREPGARPAATRHGRGHRSRRAARRPHQNSKVIINAAIGPAAPRPRHRHPRRAWRTRRPRRPQRGRAAADPGEPARQARPGGRGGADGRWA